MPDDKQLQIVAEGERPVTTIAQVERTLKLFEALGIDLDEEGQWLDDDLPEETQDEQPPAA